MDRIRFASMLREWRHEAFRARLSTGDGPLAEWRQWVAYEWDYENAVLEFLTDSVRLQRTPTENLRCATN